MKTTLSNWVRQASAGLIAALLAVGLLACGGVDSGGTGAPVTSFSTGHISGFGSIIVNGIHFDESHASIIDDDGVLHPRDDLKLGMVVEIEAGPVEVDASTNTPHGVASKVQFGQAIAGPVEAVNAAASTLVVLGQTVKVSSATSFAGVTGGVAGIRVGDLLTLHALLDTSDGTYTATRIERVASLAEYRLRGIVSQLNTSARTFVIGSAHISYAGVAAAELPTLANGLIAKVKLKTLPVAGVWQMSKGAPAVTPIPNDSQVHLEGFVANFASLADFTVAGTRVDASAADVIFKNGTRTDVVNGARVQVEGAVHGGVLIATQVEIKQAQGKNEVVVLHGALESVNAAQHSFVLRGSTVIYDANTDFDKGSASDLVVGAEVDVKGRLVTQGTQVYATRIKLGK